MTELSELCRRTAKENVDLRKLLRAADLLAKAGRYLDDILSAQAVSVMEAGPQSLEDIPFKVRGAVEDFKAKLTDYERIRGLRSD